MDIGRDIIFMMIGMAAGMASPFVMRKIKQWSARRRVNRMLQEIAQSKNEDNR